MFKIGDKVATKNYGVCVVKAIEEKLFGEDKKMYFVLENLFSNSFSTTKIYIMHEKADEQMRHLLSRTSVLQLIDSLKDIEPILINEFRTRRNVFEELYKTGDIKNHCKLIKSLYTLSVDLKSKNKALSFKDKEYFDKLKNSVFDEFAYVLDVSQKEIENLIKTKI